MRDTYEIKFHFESIDEAINELKALQNRALACSILKFEMHESIGDPARVLIETFDAMTDLAGSVAVMLGGIIAKLNSAKNRMKQEDAKLSNMIYNKK